MTTLKIPPRAPLAFRVGVVGHRPARLKHANLDLLAETLHDILVCVRKEVENVSNVEIAGVGIYDERPVILRAITPLAEGTDRLFAEQALAAGYQLCCVMPFLQAEYEGDFAKSKAIEENSLQRFHDLVERATACFELDGDRADEGAAYGAGGRVVLNQSDLLVVVWDGERQDKRGGTEETMDEAQRQGVPIVWVDAHKPHGWSLIVGASSAPRAPANGRALPASNGMRGLEDLQKWVRQALDLPEVRPHRTHRDEGPKRALYRFYRERKPRWSGAIAWALFRDLIGEFKWPRLSVYVQPFEQAVKGEWTVSGPPPIHALVEWLRPYYAWPDKLAVLYSDRYRSVFIVAYLLAALAVGMALLPIAAAYVPHARGETVAIIMEFVTISLILIMVTWGLRGRWHERWIDYRFGAELVRHLRLVAPLGGGRPFPQVPAHWAIYGQPNATWMSWYVRGVERALGLPTASVDRQYLLATIVELQKMLGGQIKFHRRNANHCRRIEHRLHVLGLGLLGLTLLACTAHLVPAFPEGGALLVWLTDSRVLIFCGGFFQRWAPLSPESTTRENFAGSQSARHRWQNI